ncbi:recombinase family protein [Microbacterium lacus]|uniref:Recombinase family protein n=1 Tax=Microbacterium lacus TaxID=415217 RepID=A0ABN2GVB7_9MICO
MSKRAALYVRQSKSDGTGDGPERQIERTRSLAELRGWTVAGTYLDDGVSASKNRGAGTAWERMLSDADAGRIDVVVGVDLDRLLRSTRDLNTLIDRGLQVVTVDGEIDLSTADGEFRATMLAGIARFEVRRKGERQARANAQRALKGAPPSGVRLTGYTQAGELHEPEAAIVRELFTRFRNGETLKGLATWLEAQGVPTRRGGRWNASTIRTLLMNPRYAGRSVHRGQVVGDARWEAIVSADLFDVVQAMITDPRRVTNREGTARKHLGAGLFICGVCDNPVRTNGLRYWCPGHVTRGMAPVDELVAGVVRARLSRGDLDALLVAPNTERLKSLRDKSSALRARLDRIAADYDAELIDGRRYAEASGKVRAELESVEQERASLATGEAVAGILTAAKPADAFEASSIAIRRNVIAALMRVRLLHVKQGRRGFNPSSVEIQWLSEAT